MKHDALWRIFTAQGCEVDQTRVAPSAGKETGIRWRFGFVGLLASKAHRGKMGRSMQPRPSPKCQKIPEVGGLPGLLKRRIRWGPSRGETSAETPHLKIGSRQVKKNLEAKRCILVSSWPELPGSLHYCLSGPYALGKPR